ncbi:reverse transcriptase [Gigaspora margarita]|uniref:Reverse transcriptase n=1 Tax=Gigaspora margarita TaxID=4874 RepID=A0A8H3ZZ47_GIGMA|nr:reverse transcriptase [Gigaspora margarita]
MNETIATNKDIFQDELHQADNEIADNSNHDQFDNSTWIPTGKMLDLPTRIHKENLLSQASRSEILRNQPQNAEIKYEASTIDKQIWKLMPIHTKDTNKLLAKIISPNYTLPIDKDEVFGDEFGSIIEKKILPISSLTKRQTVANDIIIGVEVVNPLILKVISVSAKCEGAITDYTINHKTRKTSFRMVIVIEVAQEHTTIKPMHQTKERYNTSGNKFNVSSYSMVTTNRSIMAYLYNQSRILPGMNYTSTFKIPFSEYPPNIHFRSVIRNTKAFRKMGYKRTRPTYFLFSIKNIFYSQKGWISKIDHKSKETKYLHMFHALQNGDYRDSQISNKKKQLYDYN